MINSLYSSKAKILISDIVTGIDTISAKLLNIFNQVCMATPSIDSLMLFIEDHQKRS